MNCSDKTKEELIDELQILEKSYTALREKYDIDTSHFRLDNQKMSLNEELFGKALMTSPDSININRLSDGMYVTINEGFTKTFGYTETEVIGKTSIELNIWVNQEDRNALLKKIQENGRLEDYEAIFLNKSGAVVYGLMSASLIDIEGVSHILSVIKDVVEKKRTEEALEYEKFLIDALMNNLPDQVYFKDIESRFIRVNKALSIRFGFADPTEVIGKTDFDLFLVEHAQQAFDDEQSIIHTGNIISKIEKETRHDYTDTWVSTIKIPLRDNVGNIIGTFGVSRDITENKKSEDALAKEQYLMHLLMDNLPDHIYFKDMASRFLRINGAMARSIGLDEPDQAKGKTDFDFFTEEHARQAYEDEQDIIKTGQSLRLEEKETHKDRPDTWVSTVKMPMTDNSGNIIGTFGISRDVTVRKRREMENNVLFEITQSMTTTSNLDDLLKSIHKSLGEVVSAKNCFIALMDYKSGLFSFPYYVDEFDPKPAPTSMTKSCTAYVFRTAKPFLFTQKEFDQLKEQVEVEELGSPSPSWIGIPLQTPSRVIGVLVLQHYEIANVYSDSDFRFLISIGSKIAFAIDRKQSETALFESERDLNESQKIAGLGSYNLNFITGTWTSSEILDSILGIDENYVRSVSGWLDLIHPAWKDQMKEYLQKDIIEKHNKFDKEYKIIRKSDNSERWVHGKGELILDSENNLISMFGSILNITQRKHNEEEILQKNQLLQTINAEKDKFFSILAHDLRGPLSAFVAATQIISEEIQTMGIEEIKELTESMKISATNIYMLLENLLEWSRLKRDGVNFVPEKLNLRKMIELCIEILSESARRKKIEFELSVSKEILVFADNHMLDATVRNLVSNAIKFTPTDGKIMIAAEIINDHEIEVKISDSGIGMTEELKKKLFLLNEKTSRPGTDGEPSTGLGLLLCKEFVEKNGGKIRAESLVGKGSSFYFSLPAIA